MRGVPSDAPIPTEEVEHQRWEAFLEDLSRAHQGWRYLAATDAPADIGGEPGESEALPAKLMGELSRLGLV